MKNKVIFRIISLALLVILCLGAVSCANGGGADGTSDTTGASDTTAASTDAGTTAGTTAETDDKGGSTGAKSDEALFAEVLEAYEATMAYKGALTVNATQSQNEQEGEEIYEGTATMAMSVDPEKNIYFEKEGMQSGGEYAYSYESINKVFLVDGALYEYDKNYSVSGNSEPYEDETYYKNAEGASEEEIADGLMKMIDEMIGGATKAETYADLKAAFAKVFSEIKAREIAESIEDGALKEGATITMEPEITVKKEAGETVLTIVSKFAAEELADDSSTTIKNYVINYTRTIAAKDGKISRVVTVYDISADVTETSPEGASETIKIASGINMAYSFAYSFDQAGYDAIAVSLPSDPTLIVDAIEDNGVNVTWHLGPMENKRTYYMESSSMEALFREYADDLQRDFGYEWQYSTDGDGNPSETQVPFVTVKGFYKDAALTQAIDPSTITLAELNALEGNVYVDVAIKDGMAIVNDESGREEQLSIEYQIVASSMFGSRSSAGILKPSVVSVSNPLKIRDEESKYEYKVLVNGVETEGNTITLENGKIYVIKTLRIIKDADLDMDHIIPEIF
ncbi:MAG: hypothetical protein IKL59_06560 [Clostridia bacterium]|nr:hypothetical protein [Clostridia bacterium]